MTSLHRCGGDADAGLRPTDQPPVDAVAHVDAGAHAPADLWHEIAMAEGFQRELVESVRDLLTGTHRHDWVSTLLDAGITARDGRYANRIAWLDRSPEVEAHQDALAYTAALGQGTVTVTGERCTLADALNGDLASGPLALLDTADRTPTLAVRLGEQFRERPREQRERTLELLGVLGTVCTVDVVTTRLTARWLLEAHGRDLPTEFNDYVDAGCSGPSSVGVDVEAALADLDPDGQPVALLRALADEPNERLSLSELTATQPVGKSAVVHAVNTLEDRDLVDRFRVGREKHIQLLQTGAVVIDRLESSLGRQSQLDREFNSLLHSADSDVVHALGTPAPEDRPAEQPAEDDTGVAYRTRYLSRAGHAAAGAAATDGAVTVVESVLPSADDAEARRTRYVSYDADRDEVVAAVRATTPTQYMTSIAMAFSTRHFLEKVLPPSRLEGLDLDTSLLRDARCIGALSDEAAEDGEKFLTELSEWGDRLGDMTRTLHHGDPEDRDTLCGEILRSAQGLGGTLSHLFDVAGVDVVRELRVPTAVNGEKLDDLAETVATAVSIQSRYGNYATYRQLYETRDEKKTLRPPVDADDPLGEYIGALVIRGPSADRLADRVKDCLQEPADLRDDAPEIAVEVPFETPNREDYIAAVNRVGEFKNLRATPEAVALFQALTGDPYAVADAVYRLAAEDADRRIRLDEVRVSLATLEADRLLPNTPPTVSKAVAVLLRTDGPLTQTALADQADVARSSISRNIGALAALDIVRETGEGLRLTLPFATDEERGQSIRPTAVDEGRAPTDLLFDVALELADADRLADPDDPIGAAFHYPPDIDSLRAHLPGIDPWVRVARALCNAVDPPPATITFGASLQQASLHASTTGGVAD